jgi:hypothetical protein
VTLHTPLALSPLSVFVSRRIYQHAFAFKTYFIIHGHCGGYPTSTAKQTLVGPGAGRASLVIFLMAIGAG